MDGDDDMPEKVYHISSYSPEALGYELKPFENTAIDDNRYNAVWAYGEKAGPNNPYMARNKKYGGMIVVGNYAIYEGDNIVSKGDRLELRDPVYQYTLDPKGFRRIVESNNGGNVEYIHENGPIRLIEGQYEAERISDVTSLCDSYQVFSDVSSEKNIGATLVRIIKSYDAATALEYLDDMVRSGGVVYHNRDIGRNETLGRDIERYARERDAKNERMSLEELFDEIPANKKLNDERGIIMNTGRMEPYRDKIIGGCHYIAEQYALEEVDPEKCDSYEKRKYMLERTYGVKPDEWFAICNQDGSALMQDLIAEGDLGAGMSFLANCALGRENENVATDIFMSHDGETTMYDFLRRVEDDPSITKDRFDEAAKAKAEELTYLDNNINASILYIAKQHALSKMNPILCDDYDKQKETIKCICGIDDTDKLLGMIDFENPKHFDEMIREGNRNAGLSIVANYTMDKAHAGLVGSMLMDADTKTSVYAYLRAANDDPSITKADILSYDAINIGAECKPADKPSNYDKLSAMMSSMSHDNGEPEIPDVPDNIEVVD